MDIVERLRFDAVRCDATFSKGVATNIEEAANEIGRLRAALTKTLIGVNHIALYRSSLWPDYGSDHVLALGILGPGREYDMWCCWNAAMCARDELEKQP